jgi:putative SOS response-associated peptidase YedK
MVGHVQGELSGWTPSWNIKPIQPVAVILERAKDENEPLRRLGQARWGSCLRGRRN